MRQDFGYCDTFEFSVLATNDVGPGNKSAPVAATFLGRKMVLASFPGPRYIPQVTKAGWGPGNGAKILFATAYFKIR